jgi:membrane-associated phospholipid phosphatase
MQRDVALLVGVLFLAPTAARASDPQSGSRATDATEQQAQAPGDPQPPIANEPKPTRNFASALVHNLGDDFKHLPRRNTVYWLAGGTAAALAVHPLDDNVHQHFLETGGGNAGFWKAGEIIGETPTILGAAGVTYLFGRGKHSQRATHLGMDEIEATLIAEGLVNGIKVIGRRKRPLQSDGTRASGFAFPSGHSTLTFAAATVLQQHLGYKAAIPTYAVAAYVAASRLHDNVHWTSDVVFGAALGVAIGRTVTWHGRNFYGSPMLLPGGGGVVVAIPTPW